MKKILLALAISPFLIPYQALAQELSQAEMLSFVDKIKANANHLFSYQNGLNYGYEQKLSQNAQDSGAAAAPLIFFRYSGYSGTMYTVFSDSEQIAVSCDLKQACKFLTAKQIFNGQVVNSSVIPGAGTVAQAALFDAMAGNLTIYDPNLDAAMQSHGWNSNDKYSDALILTLSKQDQEFANEYWIAERSCGFTEPSTLESSKNCEIADHAYRELHKVNVCWTQDSPYSVMAQHRWGFCPPGEDLIIDSIPPAPAKPLPKPPTTNPQAKTEQLQQPATSESQEAIKPSFDCKKAYFADEVTICNTPALARLDDKLALKYAQAKSAAKDHKAFISAQREALLARRDCHTDVSCLTKWYQDRKVALDAVIHGSTQ